ncbi:pyrroline-5-carboxylate reductase [Oligoflexaceae bacterium]|nr:pyrroline-5-carboxylate reductase [Oligoflexaceae bacterium]
MPLTADFEKGGGDLSNKILFVGLGKMGASLLKGLADSGFKDGELFGYDLHEPKRDELNMVEGIKISAALDDDVFDLLVLCVKPQDLGSAAKACGPSLKKGGAVVSILAGVTSESVHAQFKQASFVIRAMPNIAALVGEAATVLAGSVDIPSELKARVTDIFSRVGSCHWSKESLMDAVTGLSGSGPAYVYMIIEALADGGVKMGLPRRLALDLSVQTILGAGKLVKESGLHPAVLREEVTTPGGTTIHAIQDLEERGLRAMLMSAVEKATIRSQDLNK